MPIDPNDKYSSRYLTPTEIKQLAHQILFASPAFDRQIERLMSQENVKLKDRKRTREIAMGTTVYVIDVIYRFAEHLQNTGKPTGDPSLGLFHGLPNEEPPASEDVDPLAPPG